MATILRAKYPYLSPSLSIDHLVIGAGVVGLAIAERLTTRFPSKTTFLIERHAAFGKETSSRNSEVIHSGLHYPLRSAKTALCIRSRGLLYERCERAGIPYRKCGKITVAMDEGQLDYLKALFEKVQTIEEEGIGKVPLEWMTGDQVRRIEPDVAPECVGGLYSSETGIIDSHALMEDLEKGIEESDGGEVVYGTKVVRIDRLENLGGRKGDGSEEGWVVQTVTGGSAMEEGERNAVLCRAVINSAGLNAHHLHNQILPPSSRVPLYFAKGSYFTYRGPGLTNVSHLLYPCPDHTGGSLAGLGTHLTFNLAGEICFGPDVEWIQAPFCEVQGGVEDVSDFWERELVPRRERLEGVYEAVRRYLPGVEKDGFETDYVGIRPKLSAPGAPAADFSISHPRPGFISLLGIESPGLTSSLGIAERVEGIVRKEVWGLGRGGGDKMSETGPSNLDGWA